MSSPLEAAELSSSSQLLDVPCKLRDSRVPDAVESANACELSGLLLTRNKPPDRKWSAPRAGDDGYFAMQDTDGTVNAFFLGRRDSYDLFEDSTRNGVRWTQRRFASAINSADLVPVLAGSGTGVVYEADSASHILAQPILDAQSVRISLKHSHVHAGQSIKLTGSVSPRLKNQLVTLERLKGKRWYTVRTTHESATGKFSFTLPGVTRTYRAVVADKPGYYEYGYSNMAKLKA